MMRQLSTIVLAFVVSLIPAIGLADDAPVVKPLSEPRDWGRIVQLETALELHVERVPENRSLLIPRLNNRIKQISLKGSDAEVGFKPLLTEWELTLPPTVEPGSAAVVLFETVEPVHLPVKPEVVAQSKSGDIDLPAHKAVTHGKLLRFEPQPHKNTVGYWANADDWFEWYCSVEKPGEFTLEVLQGCGTGQGGSLVQIEVAGQKIEVVNPKIEFTIEDTGHFQNFKPRQIGSVWIEKAGEYRVQVRTLKKAKNAVCDIRLARLISKTN